MSLKCIARELYRLNQAVDLLKKELSNSSPGNCDALKLKLARSRNERDQMKKVLDGHLDR